MNYTSVLLIGQVFFYLYANRRGNIYENESMVSFLVKNKSNKNYKERKENENQTIN